MGARHPQEPDMASELFDPTLSRHAADRPIGDVDGTVRGRVPLRIDVTQPQHLAEQLRRAQKMAAVGRLAGGLVHDFGNMMTIVKSCCQLMVEELRPDDPMRANVEQVLKATQQAAALTARLLNFSHREAVSSQPLDLNALVASLEPVLRSLLGEEVEFNTVLGPSAWPVLADAGELEQAIVNLVLNARDAMPRGGRLTIETGDGCREATPPLVALRVRDTGVGMDEATRARIFEPFFTTKGAQGTGLGLASVARAIKQAGGHIEVESESGRGTTFTVLLPRVLERGGNRCLRGSRFPGS
jgi:two-component system cell cycle sensor histidine kinase/response regulator CckA